MMNHIPNLHPERHSPGYSLLLLGSIGTFAIMIYLMPEWITLIGYFLICMAILVAGAVTDHIAHQLSDTPESSSEPVSASRPTNSQPDANQVLPKDQPQPPKPLPALKYSKAPLADVLSINADDYKRELVISLM